MAATENQLSKSAKVFLGGLFVLAAIAIVPSLARLSMDTEGWLIFAIFGSAAAVAQLFPVHTLKNNAFTPAIVFMLPAVFLLPPELIALMPIVMHLPEWLRVRYPWFMQTFNIANHTINLFAAWAVANFVLDHAPGPETRVWAMAGIAATLVYVILNHTIVAVMLRLARGMRLRETGLLSFQSLSNEMVVGLLGFGLVSFWHTNPWLIPIGIAPMLLIHRSLAVPALEEEARVDPKTGLFNARHFATSLAEELGRAVRFERPLSLIMADLDLLRDINNTYGHLAGDAVLRGIAQIFRAQLRHYDVPARFGGEEFSILLPETPPDQALEIAERIRRAVAEASFEVETSSEPIRATVSIGVVRIPEGRDRRERADPPGRSRRLPREAPGPQPRAGRQRRLAPGQRGSFPAARRRARRTETTSSRFRAPQSRCRRKTAARSRLRVRWRSRAHGSSRSHAASVCSSAR